MKKIIIAVLALSLQACAIFTASPSLPAYIAAHSAGIAATAAVGTAVATAEGVVINTETLVKDAQAK